MIIYEKKSELCLKIMEESLDNYIAECVLTGKHLFLIVLSSPILVLALMFLYIMLKGMYEDMK